MNEYTACVINIHMMGYYSAFKMEELLTQATTWINPEDIVLVTNAV
jgi:hypothetical protein